MRVFAGAAALLVLMPSLSVADDGFIGINYTQLEQDDRFFRTTLTDEASDNSKYRFNYHAGAYLGLGYRFGSVRPYALVGFTAAEEKIERAVWSFKNTIEDVSYGVGADFIFGERLGVNVEYTQYYDIGDVTYKGPSVGLVHQF